MSLIKIGGRGRSNARVLQAERSGRIPYAIGRLYWWVCRLRLQDFTPDAATAQTIDLNTLASTRLTFPTDVIRELAYVVPTTAWAGGAVSAMDGLLGDTNDPNGLVTMPDLFTASTDLDQMVASPSAAEYAPRPEAAFAPLVTLNSTGANLDALTAGAMQIVIGFRKRVDFV
jgi:hypothetical protein